MSIERFFLRATIQPLNVTSTAGARHEIVLPEEVLWAGQLAEFELVEVVRLSTGQTFTLPVALGLPEQVVLPSSLRRYLQPGDELSVFSFGRVIDAELDHHRTKLVEIGGANRAFEVRSVQPRSIRSHPMSLAMR